MTRRASPLLNAAAALALGLAGLGVVGGCAPPPSEMAAQSESPSAGELLPTRVRRLSNVELERSVEALLGIRAELADRLPPDVRQDGYTLNAAQSLPSATGVGWASLSEELAGRAVSEHPERFLGCTVEACFDPWLAQTARRAWRRPPNADELRRLRRLFQVGLAQGGPRGGASLTLTALLQSPNFLYVTELGEAWGSASIVRLTPYELAAELAYTLSGAPPDDELLAAAERGALYQSSQRREHAWRLLSKSSTRHHFRRFVLEWLEVDELESTAKNPDEHPDYEQLKPHMLDETRAFVDEVMVQHQGHVGALLASGFASVDPSMARYYGLSAYGPAVPLVGTDRVGVLQQASFLSAHSLPDRTSPVLRGDFILRRVLCRPMPRPAELGIEVVMPPPEPGLSTRQLFDRHTADPACRSCHQIIDPLGYSLEGFDSAGHARAQDGGHPVNDRAVLPLDGEKITLEGGARLSRWLARQPNTKDCFARQSFRYFSAQSDPAVERAFLRVVRELPPAKRGSLIDIVLAYVESELFLYRDARGSRSTG